MILVIDNYDSFTYNLVHYLQIAGAKTHVIRNDDLGVQEILELQPKGVLISPGPCTPDQAGVCLDFVREAPASLPVFGVCLGHQAIAQAFGGKIIAAKTIMHGKTSPITHEPNPITLEQRGLFETIPDPFIATRYHSLAVCEKSLPECLDITARTEDQEIMAIEHVSRPVFGVQFHPESIATEHGQNMVNNFIKICKHE